MLSFIQCLLLCYLAVTTAHAEEMLIAVAADATEAVQEIDGALKNTSGREAANRQWIIRKSFRNT